MQLHAYDLAGDGRGRSTRLEQPESGAIALLAGDVPTAAWCSAIASMKATDRPRQEVLCGRYWRVMSKVVSGWGVDKAVTTFQKGFRCQSAMADPRRYHRRTWESGVLRPNYVPGCDKTVPPYVPLGRNCLDLNPSCFHRRRPTGVFRHTRVVSIPPFEGQGINNWGTSLICLRPPQTSTG